MTQRRSRTGRCNTTRVSSPASPVHTVSTDSLECLKLVLRVSLPGRIDDDADILKAFRVQHSGTGRTFCFS
jgi:hypothetical protein